MVLRGDRVGDEDEDALVLILEMVEGSAGNRNDVSTDALRLGQSPDEVAEGQRDRHEARDGHDETAPEVLGEDAENHGAHGGRRIEGELVDRQSAGSHPHRKRNAWIVPLTVATTASHAAPVTTSAGTATQMLGKATTLTKPIP